MVSLELTPSYHRQRGRPASRELPGVIQLFVEEQHHCPGALDFDFCACAIGNSFVLSLLLSGTEYAVSGSVDTGYCEQGFVVR